MVGTVLAKKLIAAVIFIVVTHKVKRWVNENL